MLTIECYLGCGRTLEVDGSDPDFWKRIDEAGWGVDFGTLVFWCNQCEEDENEEAGDANPTSD